MRYTPLAMIFIGLVFALYSLAVGVGQAVAFYYVIESRNRDLMAALEKLDPKRTRELFDISPTVADPQLFVRNLAVLPRSYFDTYETHDTASTGLGAGLIVWGIAELIVRKRREVLGKRRREASQCVECGYARTGSNAPVACSECGHV